MININSKQLRATFLLIIAALIWGSTFVFQSQGAELVGPFTFNALRSILSGAILLPVAIIANKLDKKNVSGSRAKRLLVGSGDIKPLLIGGLLCGIILFCSMSLQQTGMGETTAGKAGFITALYIIFVPLIGVFTRKKVPFPVWISVMIALGGFYLLCIKPSEGFALGRGDFFVLLCAVSFSIHIVTIDRFSPKVNGVMLSCIQFWITGAISSVCMAIFEKPSAEAVMSAAFQIVYAGVMSGAVAYTLQIIAQKDCPPTVASLSMSLESVFSALSSWIILGERMSAKELVGCALIFTAIILAQLPSKLFRRQKSTAAAETKTGF